MDRRSLFKALPAAALVASLPASVQALAPAPTEGFEILPPQASLSAQDRLQRALEEREAAAKAFYPDITDWRVGFGTEKQLLYVLGWDNRPPPSLPFTGFGAHEVRLPNGCCPIVALEEVPKRGGYFWRHYWASRDIIDGKRRRFVAAADLFIKHKIRSFE